MNPGEDVSGIADASQPNAGRIYDYLLGGSHNFEIDREAAQVAEEVALLGWLGDPHEADLRVEQLFAGCPDPFQAGVRPECHRVEVDHSGHPVGDLVA